MDPLQLGIPCLKPICNCRTACRSLLHSIFVSKPPSLTASCFYASYPIRFSRITRNSGQEVLFYISVTFCYLLSRKNAGRWRIAALGTWAPPCYYILQWLPVSCRHNTRFNSSGEWGDLLVIKKAFSEIHYRHTPAPIKVILIVGRSSLLSTPSLKLVYPQSGGAIER